MNRLGTAIAVFLFIAISVSCHRNRPHSSGSGPQEPKSVTHGTLDRLDHMIMPEVYFEDLSFDEFIYYMRIRAIELETDPSIDPSKRGISIYVSHPEPDGKLTTKLSTGNHFDEAYFSNKRIGEYRVRNHPLLKVFEDILVRLEMDAYLTTTGLHILPKGETLMPVFDGRKLVVLRKITPDKPQSTNEFAPSGDAIIKKLDEIMIPIIDFEETSLEEAIDYLRVRSIELDPDREPERHGVSIMVRKKRPEADDRPTFDLSNQPRITYQALNISLKNALIEICERTDTDAYITSVGLVICPKEMKPFPNPKGIEGEIWNELTK